MNTRQMLTTMAKRVVRNLAELGIDDAGKAVCGNRWPFFKKVLSPVIEVIEDRFPLLKSNSEEAKKASEALVNSQELASLLDSGFSRQFAVLEEGQNEVIAILLSQGEILQGLRETVEKDSRLLHSIGSDVADALNLLKNPPGRPKVNTDDIPTEVDSLQRDAMRWIESNRPVSAIRRLAEARELIKEETDQHPGEIRLLTLRGFVEKSQAQVSLQTGDLDAANDAFEAAANYFNAAYKADPSDASALNGLGNIYLLLQDYKTASKFCMLALEKKPDYAEAAWDLTIALEKRLEHLGPLPELVSVLQSCYEMLEKLIPGYPGFTAQHLKHIQSRSEELRKINQVQPPVKGKNVTRQTTTKTVIRLEPKNLSLVIKETEPLTTLVNLNCDIVNTCSTPVTVKKMEVNLTTPENLHLAFYWNVFYDIQPLNLPESMIMTKTSDAHEIKIEALKSNSLGIQFQGPTVEPKHLWLPGKYVYELYALVSSQSGIDSYRMKTTFQSEIGSAETKQVKYWFNAAKKEWDRLNDPDRAIAIPLKIEGLPV